MRAAPLSLKNAQLCSKANDPVSRHVSAFTFKTLKRK